jgi:L-arabinonolactonase
MGIFRVPIYVIDMPSMSGPTGPSIASTQTSRCTSSTNGLCLSPDGATFYFADTWTGEIWAYDYDQSTGSPSNRRTFVKVDRSRGGAADGSTVDAEGCVWNALVYDGRLVPYDPSGRVERVIDMPVKKVTSVMPEQRFGA